MDSPESSDSRWIMVRKLVLSLTRLSFPAQPVFSDMTPTWRRFHRKRDKTLYQKVTEKNEKMRKLGLPENCSIQSLGLSVFSQFSVNVSSVECFSLHFHKTELVSALPRGEGWKELTFLDSSYAFQLWHKANGVKLLIKLQTAYFCSGILRGHVTTNPLYKIAATTFFLTPAMDRAGLN